MLTTSDIAGMRATLDLSLPGTAIIVRPSGSSDGMGGVTDAWAAAGTVSARLSPSGSGSDQIAGGQVINEAPWTVTVPASTDVRTTDRITISGQTLEVVAITSPRSYETCLRAACVEVR